jgi:hypothetical protein
MGSSLVRVGAVRRRAHRQMAWYVVPGGAGAKDGTSWADAFKHPQDGIDAAYTSADFKDVWVKAGTYYRVSGSFVILLKTGVTVYGGFAGTETSLAQRNFVANASIIDGANTWRCVYVGNTDSNAACDGLRIHGGYLNGYVRAAAGVQVDGNGFSLRHCILTSHLHSFANYGGIITIYGAGIVVVGNSAVITNCLIHGCTVEVDTGLCLAANAGIYGQGDTVVTCCTIEECLASAWGYLGMDAAGQGGVWTNCIAWQNWVVAGNYLPSLVVDPSPVGVATVTYSDILGGYTGAGNINADPLFVGGGNYHLGFGSPCAYSGTAVGAPEDDLDGTPRTAPVSMGAYEF